ncbi:DUF1918 domain-containing protein [Georgenia ruanii]|uniref:DUF1918 domain-containing protein n=1 Tax=Georgenia ruanii TaxID=348442 RepID=A0A7J9UZZ6_9MICO|nr:DUF1918 domain-containing protein [Georgenia ruanii]MPV89893.1 DUF1918 domain-containing protein [Georgenia ruanii]
MTPAAPGDRIVVQAVRVGGPECDGEVLEARGPGGTAPYLVRWSDTGHVSLLYPGPDAVIHTAAGVEHQRAEA